jgi:hypothetical protein
MTREEWNALKAGDEIKTATQNNHFDVVETKDDMELHRLLLRNKKTGKEFYSRQFDIFTVSKATVIDATHKDPGKWYAIAINKHFDGHGYSVAWQCIGQGAKQVARLTKEEVLGQVASMLYAGDPQYSDDATKAVAIGESMLKRSANP